MGAARFGKAGSSWMPCNSLLFLLWSRPLPNLGPLRRRAVVHPFMEGPLIVGAHHVQHVANRADPCRVRVCTGQRGPGMRGTAILPDLVGSAGVGSQHIQIDASRYDLIHLRVRGGQRVPFLGCKSILPDLLGSAVVGGQE